MPRRHKTIKHTPFQMSDNEARKVRYPSREAAEKAVEERMFLYPSLELTVYQALDGGWYLTRQSSDK